MMSYLDRESAYSPVSQPLGKPRSHDFAFSSSVNRAWSTSQSMHSESVWPTSLGFFVKQGPRRSRNHRRATVFNGSMLFLACLAPLQRYRLGKASNMACLPSFQAALPIAQKHRL